MLDGVIAFIPAFEATKLHNIWLGMVLFLVTLFFLYVADGTVEKNGFWLRMAIKIVILLVAEGVISVSALEACNASLTECHRVFF